MLCFTEENLIKKRQEILSNIENKRNIINMLTNKDSGLKQEEERLNLEIRSELFILFLLFCFHMYFIIISIIK